MKQQRNGNEGAKKWQKGVKTKIYEKKTKQKDEKKYKLISVRNGKTNDAI